MSSFNDGALVPFVGADKTQTNDVLSSLLSSIVLQ